MITTEEKKKIGKKSKRDGAKFELLVRKDLEEKGWIVSKWMNNVEFDGIIRENKKGVDFKTDDVSHYKGKLIPAKHKFCGIGRPMAIGTGFPDFIAFPKVGYNYNLKGIEIEYCKKYNSGKTEIIGVEAKSNGYLTVEEREKCSWLIQNNVFSKILIAKKDYPEENINLPPKKRKKMEIIYEDFKEKYK